MTVVLEVEQQALNLNAKQRGELISKLLRSLPEYASDKDDGVAEALQRREELRKDPTIGISLKELDQRMRERFG